MTDLPASLPARVYLLAVDPAKERVRSSSLGRALRTAALDQLTRQGLLADADKRVRVTGGPAGDAFLDSVLEGIRDSKPRRWNAWVDRGERKARPAVQEQLVAAGLIRVEPHKVLGMFPDDRVTLRDPRAVKQLREQTARALTGSEPVSRLDPDLAALAAIAALAKFGTVADWRARHRHRARIKQLIAGGGPALQALKKSLEAQAAAAAA